MRVLAILSSSRKAAHTSRNIITACRTGAIPNARVSVMISNNTDAAIFMLADETGIPRYRINSKTQKEPADEAIRRLLEEHSVDVVLLVGYAKKVGPELLDAFPGKILNSHPGPLPLFGGKGMYGIAVQEAILAAGVRTTGPTIHIVDEEYDHGPTLAHMPLTIQPSDTAEELNERCYAATQKLYPATIRRFLETLR